MPQRWTCAALSGVVEAEEVSPVSLRHPFLEMAVTSIPCNQQSLRGSGVAVEGAGRKETSCESRMGGWEERGESSNSRQTPRLGKERSVLVTETAQLTVASLLVSTPCAIIFSG